MIFYESWYEACKHITDKEAEQFKMAVLSYGCDGTIPKLEGVTMAMFLMAKPLIDANAARAENGKKGGRPRKDGNPIQRSNKCINFTPSDTDWDEAAQKIIAAQK